MMEGAAGRGEDERERERERERVVGREREIERSQNEIGKKAPDCVKTNQYLRSQIVIAKRQNDVIPFIRIEFVILKQLFAMTYRRK